MPSLSATLVTTCMTAAGGNATVAGLPRKYEITYNPFAPGNVPSAGQTFFVTLTNMVSSLVVQAGAGDVTSISPVFALTHNDQVMVLAGTSVYCSGVGDALTWNDANTVGTGYVDMSSRMPIVENLKAATPYQGSVAFFTDWYIIIFGVSSNIANWSLKQVLPNTGTLSGLTVQSVGELDVLYLGHTGVRSLRVRDASLNAYVDDVGTPINKLMQFHLLVNPLGTGACSVMEPSYMRYWVYPGTGTGSSYIYVLTRFLSSNMTAWGRYSMYYYTRAVPSVLTSFTPSKFVVYKGQVFLRTTGDVLLQYGGTDGNFFDLVPMVAQTPFYDLETPATEKGFLGIQVAAVGTWDTELFPNSKSQSSSVIVLSKDGSSFDSGIIPVSMVGTHVSVKMTSKTAVRSVYSAVVLHYKELRIL